MRFNTLRSASWVQSSEGEQGVRCALLPNPTVGALPFPGMPVLLPLVSCWAQTQLSCFASPTSRSDGAQVQSRRHRQQNPWMKLAVKASPKHSKRDWVKHKVSSASCCIPVWNQPGITQKMQQWTRARSDSGFWFPGCAPVELLRENFLVLTCTHSLKEICMQTLLPFFFFFSLSSSCSNFWKNILAYYWILFIGIQSIYEFWKFPH